MSFTIVFVLSNLFYLCITDLNNYLPLNGDYFIINYVDSNKI